MRSYNFLNFSILVFSVIFFSCGSSKKIAERKRISSQNIKHSDLKKNDQNLEKKALSLFNNKKDNSNKVKKLNKLKDKIWFSLLFTAFFNF